MNYEIKVVEATPGLVAVARGIAPGRVPDTLLELIGKVWKFLRESGIKSDGHNIAIYPGDPHKVPMEAGARVLAPFPSTDSVLCSQTPAGTAVMTTHIGPYHRMDEAHAALRAWSKTNDRKLGTNWEVYGHWTDDESQLRTDIYFLLA